MNFSKEQLRQEAVFRASRSGGKGGQNVNKVSTRVELLFDVETSPLFTDEEKQLIMHKLQSRLNKDGLLQVVCDEERSQYLNKEIAVEKLHQLITAALVKQKPRKKTKPGKAVVAARLDNKKRLSEKKESRRFRSTDQ